MSDTYGWELLCLASAETVTSKENILIKLLHWAITKSGYLCTGLGPTDENDAYLRGSETLPQGWDLLAGDCTLKYVRDREKYILCTVRTNQNLVVNFLRSRDQVLGCTLFDIEKSVDAARGTLVEMVPNYKTFIDIIRTKLTAPFDDGCVQNAETQTPHSAEPSPIPRQEEFYQRIGHGVDWDPVPRRPLSNVGRNDLDPVPGFGHGGGMLFNPFGEGRRTNRDPGVGLPGGVLPRGAVPPGARFDPFSPFGGMGGRPGPNPDHLPPPGYEDMFM